jgi:hypothetical protein
VAEIRLPSIDELLVHRAELQQPQLKPRVRLERLARELRACLGSLQRAELSMMFLNATTEEYFCGRTSLGRSERAAAQIIFVANRDQTPLVAKFFHPEASEIVSATPEPKILRIGEGWVLTLLCCFMLLCGRGFSQSIKVEQPMTPDVFRSLLNQEIATASQLTADYKKALVWQQIDANHPKAVELRSKIATEEPRLKAVAQRLSGAEQWAKSGGLSPEQIQDVLPLLKEANVVLTDELDQRERYHTVEGK